jgi:hypothetical protein
MLPAEANAKVLEAPGHQPFRERMEQKSHPERRSAKEAREYGVGRLPGAES